MNIEKAKKIIYDNCDGVGGSFADLMFCDCIFSKEKFWEYYDSIVTVASLSAEEKSLEFTKVISMSYQRILKEFMYHFALNDIACLDGFPENYNDYIERLDFAIFAYFKGDLSWVKEERFNLKRNC